MKTYKIFKETTKWDCPNHIYFLSDSKFRCYGYIPNGTKTPVMFKNSVRFDKKYRTFQEVNELPSSI